MSYYLATSHAETRHLNYRNGLKLFLKIVVNPLTHSVMKDRFR